MASQRNVFNAEEVAEMLMNYDSEEIDDSSESEANFESESVSEEERFDVGEPGPSTSTWRRGGGRGLRPRGRGMRGGRGRGAPSQNAPDFPWIEGEFAAKENAFSGAPGMNPAIDGTTPYDFYKLFVTDDILQTLVTETNRYFDQCAAAVARPLHKYSVYEQWQPVTVEEMNIFIALLMTMGITSKPEVCSYWSTEPTIATPFFSTCMSRKRFEQIQQFLHIVDNTHQPSQNDPQRDKLFKIRPLLDVFTTSCKECYSPKENLAVDESMMPWKGRLGFRMYIPSKPTKYGIKMYFCCESGSGYISRLKIYCGKEGNIVEKDHGGNVVRELLADFHGKGHTVYMDSFFSSIPLFEELKANGIDAVGTLRSNRKGMSENLRTTRMKKGEITVQHKPLDAGASLMCAKYRDKKDIFLLSTMHSGQIVETGKIIKRTNEREKKPDVVHAYNSSMNAVDQFDQNMSYYTFNRKTLKWWKRALTHLLHVSKVQAWILYNMTLPAGTNVTQYQFTVELIKQMTTDIPRLKPAASDPTLAVRRAGRHYPTLILSRAKKASAQRNCHVCTIQEKRKRDDPPNMKRTYVHRRESRFECTLCGGLALCVDPCFKLYHEHADYKRKIRQYLNLGEHEYTRVNWPRAGEEEEE